MIGRAVLGRCPLCAEGRLFSGWLSVPARCPSCDAAYPDAAAIGDGPAGFGLFLVPLLLAPAALWVAASHDWPWWMQALVWGAAAAALSLLVLRPLKAVNLALALLPDDARSR